MSKKPSIEIVVTDSTVNGGIIAGDKYETAVHVHIHKDMLESEAAVFAALAEQGQDIKNANADKILEKIVKNPELWKKLDEKRSQFEEELVDSTIDEVVSRYQRTGPTPESIVELDSMLETCWRKEQWGSVVKVGSLLLSVTYNSFEYLELVKRVAGKLFECSIKQSKFSWAMPLARSYQASNCYIIYSRRIYDLKSSLDIYKLAPVKAPLANLFSENQEALGYFKLADRYIGEAVEKAFDSGHPDTITTVLFNLAFIQYNACFLVQHLLGQDASEYRDRMFRVNGTIVQIAQKFGMDRDKAIAESNMASFFNMLGEYDKAEVMSFNAARRLVELGFAFDANRALKINESARKRESPVPSLQNVQMPEFSADQIVAMIRQTSGDQLRLQGHDIEHNSFIKEAIEVAYKDLNPNRVMRYCENIDLRYQTSPLGASVLLPSLGMKLLTCKHFNRGLGAVDLDRAFAHFKDTLNCNSCSFRTPRENWNLTLDGLDAMCGPPDAK